MPDVLQWRVPSAARARTRARRARQPLWARAALGLAVAALVLFGAEIGLRLAGVRPAYRVEDLGQWRFSGNLRARPTSGPRDGHTFLVTTNADGLRTEVPKARTPGRRRIALMGDSTVFGWGVDDGGTVADGVQAVLGADTEVLNAGQPGYSTTMMAWFFDEVLQAYQPDLTVVFIPMHDTNLVLVSDREVLSGGATLLARLRVGLAQDSRVYQALRGLLFTQTDKAWLLPDQQAGEPRVPRVSDAERTLALDGIAARAASWGGRVEVGYVPFKGDIEDHAGMQRPTRAWAEAWAREHGSEVVDASACCAGEVGLVLADDPGHLTREGNLRAGRSIATKLLHSGDAVPASAPAPGAAP